MMTTNAIPTTPAAADSTNPSVDHDSARAALRELVELSSQCALKENEIGHMQATAMEQADQELARSRSNLEMRVKSLREELQQKYDARIAQINEQFQKELAELKESEQTRRGGVQREFDKVHQD